MSDRVLGVDFSGAADAGRSTWVTEAHLAEGGLTVVDCYRAAAKWGPDRERAHAGLRARVAEVGTAGLDFPFSLPSPVLGDRCGGTWQGLLDWLADDGPTDPDA
ncbi:DUF429 domain-containing protein, partial [Halobacteriales archaeon SW_7_68_16]